MADQEPSSSEPVTNLVLVGRTGNGKSATGNMLLGENMFVSRSDAGGVTMECEMYRGVRKDGPIINVIDTPGLFDLSVSADYISQEIIHCLKLAEEGIHAVLFVLSVRNRITQEEESTLNTLQRIFESKIIDYLIVVFTGGDELDYNKQTLEDYLRGATPEFLRKVLRLCGHRKVLFNNRTTDEGQIAKQVKQLLDHVEAIKKKNGGKPYTDQMHRKIKEENDKLREKEKEIESKNLGEAELTAMKEQSRMEHQQTMDMMTQMVERVLKQSDEAHEREIRQLKEMVLLGQQNQQAPFILPFPPVGCNIM